MLFNKRAISPLVATILLIAFAVSIGALIMNWSSSTPSSTTTTAVTCEDVSINANVCFDGSNIKLMITNKGGDITRILLRSEDASSNYLVPSSILAADKTKLFFVSPNEFSSPKFSVVPVIMQNQNELVCVSKANSINNLPNC